MKSPYPERNAKIVELREANPGRPMPYHKIAFELTKLGYPLLTHERIRKIYQWKKDHTKEAHV
jgi:hypothetical protein